MAIHIVEEANRCLGCKRAFCQLKGCPVQTPIPQVIDLFKQRRLEEAGELLFQNNPMSAVCSMVCNHSGQCEGACIQGRKGTPVHFSSIENYISTAYFDRKEWTPAPSCGKQVAVVGSGPAGITVAIKMAQLGCAVTVFEQRPEIGGVLEYGIPEFRLPRALVQKYRHVMCSLGVRVRPSTTIGGALPNSGAMFGMLAAMGLNHKNSYKHIAAISIGAGMCALVVMIIMANVGIY